MEITQEDMIRVKQALFTRYDKNSWIYDDRRGLNRDTTNPSNRSQSPRNAGRDTDLMFQRWRLMKGARGGADEEPEKNEAHRHQVPAEQFPVVGCRKLRGGRLKEQKKIV